MALIDHDLYYYEDSDNKEVPLKIKNLLGCFIKENQAVMIKGVCYQSFTIVFRNKTRKYLVKSIEEAINWTKNLRIALEYKNLFDDYELLDDLGSGSYGTIKLGINLKTKQKVAVKIIQKSKLKSEELEFLVNEIDVLKFCKHPNIINFLDHFENSEYIFIIMEYIKFGDLSSYLNKKKKEKNAISEERGADISLQIAEGLDYLHKFGIVHRDLKLENIMVSKYEKNKCFEIKILDFGLSKIIGPKETIKDRYGSFYYVSPEILTDEPHNKKTDIWSFGILLYQLFSGEFPFDEPHKNKKIIAKKIVKKPLEFPENKWKYRSRELIELITKCLEKDMNKRITTKELLEDNWFKLFIVK